MFINFRAWTQIAVSINSLGKVARFYRNGDLVSNFDLPSNISFSNPIEFNPSAFARSNANATWSIWRLRYQYSLNDESFKSTFSNDYFWWSWIDGTNKDNAEKMLLQLGTYTLFDFIFTETSFVDSSYIRLSPVDPQLRSAIFSSVNPSPNATHSFNLTLTGNTTNFLTFTFDNTVCGGRDAARWQEGACDDKKWS